MAWRHQQVSPGEGWRERRSAEVERHAVREAAGHCRPVGLVQHGSTATRTDRGGRAGTGEDGDLHRWTRVDVLPPDGMQEVRSSNLLSSTAQKHNSNKSNSEYSSKIQQRRPDRPPYVCSDRGSSRARTAGRTVQPSWLALRRLTPVSWANPDYRVP